MSSAKRILLTPLDWGLGHATRCIPIIQALLQYQQNNIFIASDGGALQLLKEEFPQLQFFELPAYNISYTRENMVFNIAGQLPRIIQAIRKEYNRIQQLVKEHQIDIIISDNRYGCYSPTTRNIFLTHQLNIKAPYPILEKMIAWGNHNRLRRFDECWVPDVEEKDYSLAGELSHRANLNHIKYIGPLSRMKYYPLEKVYDLVVVLSGPEPQRSYLEEIVLKQLPSLAIKACIVQGKAQKEKTPYLKNGIKIYPYLTSKELNELMLSAKLILSRSGYSTIMDLAAMKLKALLIPTPGQTEQEYLANYFCHKKYFFTVKQSDLNLSNNYTEALRFPGFCNEKEIHSRFEEAILSLFS